jgi:hypothetical protein
MHGIPRPQLYFAWELNHHNAYLANPALLRAMLEAVRDSGSNGSFREEFSARLISTGLPGNVRADSNRSDVWRDYQQLLKEWSLVRESGDRFRLSALGELALSSDPKRAVALAVFRFQYPNGYKRRYPKWSRSTPEGPRGPSDWCEYLLSNGVCVRPALLVARLLTAAGNSRRVARLTADDIRQRLFRVTTEPNSDEELAERFFEPPDTDWAKHTKRNAEEWIRALTATGLFEQERGSNALVVVEAQREALSQLTSMVRAEPHWNPAKPSVADPGQLDREWFEYVQGLISDRQDPPLLQPPGVDAEVHAPELQRAVCTRPYARRSRYCRTDPRLPAGFDSAAAMARQRAAEQLHEDLVDALATRLLAQGLVPEEDPNSVDMLVCTGGRIEIFEVKTIERSNWTDRLRLAVGQLLEYQSRLLQSHGVLPDTTLVISRRIELDPWLKQHFRRLGIKVLAFDAGDFIPLS